MLHPDARAEEGAEHISGGREQEQFPEPGSGKLEVQEPPQCESACVLSAKERNAFLLSFDGIHTSPSFSSRRKENMPGFPGSTGKILSHWCQSVFSICYIQIKVMVSHKI